MIDTTLAEKLLRENGYAVTRNADGFTASCTVIALIAVKTLNFSLRFSRSEDRIVMTGRNDAGETRQVEWPLAELQEAALMAVDTKFRAERS